MALGDDSATTLNIRVTEYNPTNGELMTTKSFNKYGVARIGHVLDQTFIHDGGRKDWY